ARGALAGRRKAPAGEKRANVPAPPRGARDRGRRVCGRARRAPADGGGPVTAPAWHPLTRQTLALHDEIEARRGPEEAARFVADLVRAVRRAGVALPLGVGLHPAVSRKTARRRREAGDG